MTKTKLLIVLIACVGLSQRLMAAPAAIVGEALSTEELRELQAKLNRRSSLAVNFIQTRTSALRPNRPSVSSGNAIFAKPAKFRWVLEKPLAEVMIFDGSSILSYKPGDKSVTRFKAEGERSKEIKEIIDFVLDFDALLKRYHLLSAVRNGQIITMSMQPKSASQVASLNISVDGKDSFVIGVNMIFQNKNTSDIHFSNPVTTKLDAKSFSTPNGLTILDGI